ncbi:prepilin-type N-terminal cleavage/methylation domain-containing protein [Phragmitibacter flavus]|uniref:Prepilin-type N-terminal cleavage/methylation domain-containing protein n=1 Tax=Phragmitibacter flavus TaxID=2576071 RepID=A0A5R8K9C3_9BACT|nr:prepilin-type N-terminal cleavage/methylation domain-containing protein [Phragmitibacter flavus]TLD68932.1 prepilin-type N-terminal cleavage/methylation domain-containing protein [Phragmitibacter flavus]
MRNTIHRVIPACARAFSLLELVVVMALIALLVAIATPAMAALVGSTGLTAAGNLVTHLAAQARQMAMTKNTVTALAVLGDLGVEDDFRTLAIMEYDASNGWTQATPWQALPSGVLVDFADRRTCTFVSQAGVPLPLAPEDAASGSLPFDYQGVALSSATCALRVFLPNGGLHDSESPARIRLVEGVKQGAVMKYRNTTSDGSPGNFYDVSLIGATGLAKINRP